MGEVIKPRFGNPRKSRGSFERVYGVVAGIEIGLLRVGLELHVAVGWPQNGFSPRPVAILLATPDGETDAERIGLAVVQGLQIAQLYDVDSD